MQKNLEITTATATLNGPAKEERIPFLSGRPVRKKVISSEDILNLQIALNTSKSLEEFLLRV